MRHMVWCREVREGACICRLHLSTPTIVVFALQIPAAGPRNPRGLAAPVRKADQSCPPCCGFMCELGPPSVSKKDLVDYSSLDRAHAWHIPAVLGVKKCSRCKRESPTVQPNTEHAAHVQGGAMGPKYRNSSNAQCGNRIENQLNAHLAQNGRSVLRNEKWCPADRHCPFLLAWMSARMASTVASNADIMVRINGIRSP